MLLKLECNKCRHEETADLVHLIRTLIHCAEKNHIFAGFYCDNCHSGIECELHETDSGFNNV